MLSQGSYSGDRTCAKWLTTQYLPSYSFDQVGLRAGLKSLLLRWVINPIECISGLHCAQLGLWAVMFTDKLLKKMYNRIQEEKKVWKYFFLNSVKVQNVKATVLHPTGQRTLLFRNKKSHKWQGALQRLLNADAEDLKITFPVPPTNCHLYRF